MEEMARQRIGKRSRQKSIPERGNSLAVFEEQVRDDTLVLLLEQPGVL